MTGHKNAPAYPRGMQAPSQMAAVAVTGTAELAALQYIEADDDSDCKELEYEGELVSPMHFAAAAAGIAVEDLPNVESARK
jgi:hypothetical protein